MSRRVEQVSKVLQAEVGKCISDLNFGFLATVSWIDLSPDLKYAKIFLLVLSQNPKKSLENLNQRKSEILKCLKEKKLKLRDFPHIEFHQDMSGEYTQKIDKLLDQVKQKSK